MAYSAAAPAGARTPRLLVRLSIVLGVASTRLDLAAGSCRPEAAGDRTSDRAPDWLDLARACTAEAGAGCAFARGGRPLGALAGTVALGLVGRARVEG